MKYLTYRDLFARLVADRHRRDDATLDQTVVVRITDMDGDCHVGGLSYVSVDPGCTEQYALILDASQEPEDAPSDGHP